MAGGEDGCIIVNTTNNAITTNNTNVNKAHRSGVDGD